MKLEEMTPTIEVLDCQTNSPCQHLRKCIRNSLENMHADVNQPISEHIIMRETLKMINKVIYDRELASQYFTHPSPIE